MMISIACLLRLLLIAFALATGSHVFAVGLGDIRLHSRLGDRLYAEVDIELREKDRLLETCISLRQPAGDMPWLERGTLTLRKGRHPSLVIRSATAIRDPILRIGLSVACGFEVQRDYTLLLLPPEIGVNASQAILAGERAADPEVASAPFPLTTAAISPHVSRVSSTGKMVPERQAIRAENYTLFLLTATLEADEPSLRLSPELASWREQDDAARESRRNLLRLEYRMLQMLHEQATAQLETAEKIRQMETMLAELQQRAGEVAQRVRPDEPVATATPTLVTTPTPTATPLPTPTPESAVPPQPVVRERSWVFYALLGGVLLIVVAVIRRLFRRREPDFADEPEALDDVPVEAPDEPVPPRLRLPRKAKGAKGGSPGSPLLNNEVPPPTPPGPLSAPTTLSQASEATLEEHSEANPVLELAEIMLSFGRVKGAAQALQEFIDGNPDEALRPWIRLMDVYRLAGMRSEFERVSAELNQHFNVEIQHWDDPTSAARTRASAGDKSSQRVEPLPIQWPKGSGKARSIEELKHISDRLVELWPSAEAAQYLDELLRSNRGGLRTGFSLAVVEELLFLIEVQGILAKIANDKAAAEAHSA